MKLNTKENIMKHLEKEIKCIRDEAISDQAYEYIDEDWLSKEEIMEKHLNICETIENAEADWRKENFIWDNWYARGQEVAMRDLLNVLELLRESHPRQSDVFELKNFAMISPQQIADMLAISTRTVDNDLKFAVVWLRAKLTEW